MKQHCNPGARKRAERRMDNHLARETHRRLAEWVRGKKREPAYYAWRHRRKVRT